MTISHHFYIIFQMKKSLKTQLKNKERLAEKKKKDGGKVAKRVDLTEEST